MVLEWYHGFDGITLARAPKVAHFPIDAAIGWTQEDGTRKHWAAGANNDDNLADPDAIAETYYHVHRQPRSTWTYEVILRPWSEKW